MAYRSAYPVFAVSVDLCLVSVRSGVFSVLLVERGEEPFRGRVALPGGFVRPDESLEQAAERELSEETGITVPAGALEQLRTYGDVGRDPRPERVVSVAHLAFLPDLPEAAAGTDARDARWWPVEKALAADLAFDHAQILRDGVARVRAKLEYTTVACRFCGPRFTLTELRQVYEAVWGVRLDPRNFRRKVLAVPGFVVDTGETEGGVGRPARLYRAGAATVVSPALRGVG